MVGNFSGACTTFSRNSLASGCTLVSTANLNVWLLIRPGRDNGGTLIKIDLAARMIFARIVPKTFFVFTQ